MVGVSVDNKNSIFVSGMSNADSVVVIRQKFLVPLNPSLRTEALTEKNVYSRIIVCGVATVKKNNIDTESRVVFSNIT